MDTTIFENSQATTMPHEFTRILAEVTMSEYGLSRSRWKEQMAGAAEAVYLICTLMVIAQKQQNFDLPAPSNPPYSMLGHNSFVPAVSQITRVALDALNRTEENMFKIGAKMQTVPQAILLLLQLTTNTSNEDIRGPLDILLADINSTIKSSTAVAEKVEQEMSGMTTLLNEIAAAIKGNTKAPGSFTRRAAERASNDHQYEEQLIRLMEDRQKQWAAEEAFAKAIANVPTGWQILGLQLVRALGRIYVTATPGFNALAYRAPTFPMNERQSKSDLARSAENFGASIRNFLDSAVTMLKGRNDPDDVQNFQTVVAEINKIVVLNIEKFKESSVYDQLRNIVGNASALAGASINDEKRLFELKDNLYHAAQALENQAEKINPHVVLKEVPVAAFALGKNERFKAELAHQQLREAIARDEEYFRKIMEMKEELTRKMTVLPKTEKEKYTLGASERLLAEMALEQLRDAAKREEEYFQRLAKMKEEQKLTLTGHQKFHTGAYSLGSSERLKSEMALQLLRESAIREERYLRQLLELNRKLAEPLTNKREIAGANTTGTKIDESHAFEKLQESWARLHQFFKNIADVIKIGLEKDFSGLAAYVAQAGTFPAKTRPIVLRSLSNALWWKSQTALILSHVAAWACTSYGKFSRTKLHPLILTATKILQGKTAEADLTAARRLAEEARREIADIGEPEKEKILRDIEEQNARIDNMFNRRRNITKQDAEVTTYKNAANLHIRSDNTTKQHAET